jgi:DNA-binding CsgD family transcriptional regulator
MGECRDLGDDPAIWRQHGFAGVARLIGADLVAGGELAGVRSGVQRELGNASWGWEHGFNLAGWLQALELFGSDPSYSSQLTKYAERLRMDERVVLTGSDLVGEKEFLRGIEYQLYRVMGVHHTLFCSRFIPGAPDETNGGLFWRATGRPNFNEREKAILGQAYDQITPLVGGPLARFTEPSPSDLPPRPRLVLKCLLEGDSDKQIAARLRISPYTVHQYVKSVYNHFGVTSRAELLARWVKRGWNGRAAWADGHS